MKSRALLTLYLMMFLLQTAATPLLTVHACQTMDTAISSQVETSEDLSSIYAHHAESMDGHGAMLSDNANQACQCDDCSCPQAQCHSSSLLMIFTQTQDLAVAQNNCFNKQGYAFLSHLITPDIRPPIVL